MILGVQHIETLGHNQKMVGKSGRNGVSHAK